MSLKQKVFYMLNPQKHVHSSGKNSHGLSRALILLFHNFLIMLQLCQNAYFEVCKICNSCSLFLDVLSQENSIN